MAFSIAVTARKLFSLAEKITTGKLNLANYITIALSGAASTDQIENRAVTSAKVENFGTFFEGTDSGTANAHAVAITSGISAWATGIMFFYKVNATNTSSSVSMNPTPSVGGVALGAKTIRGPGGRSLVIGELRAGTYVLVRYDGTYLQLLSQSSINPVRMTNQPANDTWALTSDGTVPYTSLENLADAIILVPITYSGAGAVTLALDGLTAKPVLKLNEQEIEAGDLQPGMVVALSYFADAVSETGAYLLLSPVYQTSRVTVPVRQTVLSGPVDSNGHPVVLSYSGQDITLEATADDPLVAAIAAGFDAGGAVDYVHRLAADAAAAWTLSTSDATYYLFIDRNSSTGAITYGSTTTRPVYTEDDAAAVTSGLHTFLINRMQMYVGDGSTAAAKQRVFVGEAVVSGGAITGVTSYMFNGRFKSATDQAISASNTTWTETHKLGLQPRVKRWVLVNQTAEGDIAQTNELDVWALTGASTYQPPTTFDSLTTSKLSAMWSTYAPSIYEPSSGTPTVQAIAFANWKLRLYASRGW